MSQNTSRWFRISFSKPDKSRYLGIIIHFISQHFFTFPDKITFSPDSPVFSPISVTTALTKTVTHPSTLGGNTLNSVEHFMTYPKVMWGKRDRIWGKWVFCGEKVKNTGGRKYIPLRIWQKTSQNKSKDISQLCSLIADTSKHSHRYLNEYAVYTNILKAIWK